jgi:hypothetical protein
VAIVPRVLAARPSRNRRQVQPVLFEDCERVGEGAGAGVLHREGDEHFAFVAGGVTVVPFSRWPFDPGWFVVPCWCVALEDEEAGFIVLRVLDAAGEDGEPETLLYCGCAADCCGCLARVFGGDLGGGGSGGDFVAGDMRGMRRIDQKFAGGSRCV